MTQAQAQPPSGDQPSQQQQAQQAVAEVQTAIAQGASREEIAALIAEARQETRELSERQQTTLLDKIAALEQRLQRWEDGAATEPQGDPSGDPGKPQEVAPDPQPAAQAETRKSLKGRWI